MLGVLQFIFSSFWIWLGTVILLGIIGACAVDLVGNIFQKRY